MKYLNIFLTLLVFASIIYLVYFFSFGKQEANQQSYLANENISSLLPVSSDSTYSKHENIITSVFWVGEKADNANDFIANKASAWDENWQDHFGGVDDPENRSGFLPAGFTPKENPFYFALPYNDFDFDGNRKPDAIKRVYWSKGKELSAGESMCKNQWIKITKNGLDAYAQWEDVGPFGEDDVDYVFGDALPSNTEKSAAGLDVSPAVKEFLGLSGIDSVDWQFVRENEVPDGPWKQVVTTRNGD